MLLLLVLSEHIVKGQSGGRAGGETAATAAAAAAAGINAAAAAARRRRGKEGNAHLWVEGESWVGRSWNANTSKLSDRFENRRLHCKVELKLATKNQLISKEKASRTFKLRG